RKRWLRFPCGRSPAARCCSGRRRVRRELVRCCSAGNAPGIRAAVYDGSGGLVHGNIIVNVFNPGGPPIEIPNDVTALPDGGFIVAWEGSGGDLAQRFDEAGNLVGTPFVFSNTPTIDVNAATYSDGR